MNEFNLSQFIKARRTELGLTTRELADKVGVTASTISKWERGDVSHMKEDKIRPLADALLVHPLTFFGYTDLSKVKEYDETEIKRIPFYSVHNTDFFNEHNVLKFVCTDVDADFAVAARNSHEDTIRPQDVLLFSRGFNNLHNKYLLMIDDNPNNSPFIDKAVVVHGQLFLYNDGQYSSLDENVKIIGVLVEIRRPV